MKIFTVFVILMINFGCSMPTTTVRTVDNRPSISIKGATPTAVLFVDDLEVGKANEFNGSPNVLNLEPGTHKIRIFDKGKIVHEQVIFTVSGIKTITIN